MSWVFAIAAVVIWVFTGWVSYRVGWHDGAEDMLDQIEIEKKRKGDSDARSYDGGI